jgi:hypothetical protein
VGWIFYANADLLQGVRVDKGAALTGAELRAGRKAKGLTESALVQWAGKVGLWVLPWRKCVRSGVAP